MTTEHGPFADYDAVTHFNLIGPRDRRLDGQYIVGKTRAGKAICYAETVNSGVLRAMFEEADALGCERPLQVYGRVCTLSETKSFRFHQLVGTTPTSPGGTQHDHREYVEGCFRCDLSRDETTPITPGARDE